MENEQAKKDKRNQAKIDAKDKREKEKLTVEYRIKEWEAQLKKHVQTGKDNIDLACNPPPDSKMLPLIRDAYSKQWSGLQGQMNQFLTELGEVRTAASPEEALTIFARRVTADVVDFKLLHKSFSANVKPPKPKAAAKKKTQTAPIQDGQSEHE